jgi:hypothetical protein
MAHLGEDYGAEDDHPPNWWDAATAANAVAAQAGQDDPYAAYFNYTSPPDEPAAAIDAPLPPAALAAALDNRGWFDKWIDKKFGTNAAWTQKQDDIQTRLKVKDPEGKYAPYKPRDFNLGDAAGMALGVPPMGFLGGLIPTTLQRMGFDVQAMTPYGLADMQRDEAEKAAKMESFGHFPPVESSGDDVFVQDGTQVAGVGPGAARTLGAGGSFRSARFSGYPDFTKPNPFG